MNAAIDAIKAQIKNKKATLARLKERMEEWKRLQAEIVQIPKVEADLRALERSLAILKGEEVQETPVQIPLRPPLTDGTTDISSRRGRPDSVPNLVYSVLKEAGKPQTIQQIMPLLKAKGCTVGEPTVRGAIYRNIKTRKLFRLVAPGTFGLLEWPETKG